MPIKLEPSKRAEPAKPRAPAKRRASAKRAPAKIFATKRRAAQWIVPVATSLLVLLVAIGLSWTWLASNNGQPFSSDSSSSPTAAQSVVNKPPVFAVLDAQGLPVSRHTDWAAACATVPENGIIEIEATQPWRQTSLSLPNIALTIRAAPGTRPLIEQTSAKQPLFDATAALTLVGLDLHRDCSESGSPLIRVLGNSARLTNCQLSLTPTETDSLLEVDSLEFDMSDCLCDARLGSAIRFSRQNIRRMEVNRCLIAARFGLLINLFKVGTRSPEISLSRTVWAGEQTIRLEELPPFPSIPRSLLIRASKNLFRPTGSVVSILSRRKLPAEKLDSIAKNHVIWSDDDCNIYPVAPQPLLSYADGPPLPAQIARLPFRLALWTAFWKLPSTTSVELKTRFISGELDSSAPHRQPLRPSDFSARFTGSVPEFAREF